MYITHVLSALLGDSDVVPRAVTVRVHVGLQSRRLTIGHMHHHDLTTNQTHRERVVLRRLST